MERNCSAGNECHVDDAVHRLSWLVFRQLLGPDFGSGPEWDGSWAAAQVNVMELWDEHGGDGVRAAEAYMSDTGETDAYAVVQWMTAGAFKGVFGTFAEFCEGQFSGAIDNHFEQWAASEDVGFPVGVYMSEAIGDGGWEFIAEAVVHADPQVFLPVEGDDGVYVFDVLIDIDEYRDGE